MNNSIIGAYLAAQARRAAEERRRRNESAMEFGRSIVERVRDITVRSAEVPWAETVRGLDDPLFRAAADLFVAHRDGVVHLVELLSRRLGCGYGRAARLTDTMDQAGLLAREARADGTVHVPLVESDQLGEVLFWLRRRGPGWRGFLSDIADPRFRALAELLIDYRGGWSGSLFLVGRQVGLDERDTVRYVALMVDGGILAPEDHGDSAFYVPLVEREQLGDTLAALRRGDG